MNQPLKCWNCHKMFADVLKGSIQVLPSTNLKDVKLDNDIQLEILCNRCKKLNKIINI